jgi:hypothetical protein
LGKGSPRRGDRASKGTENPEHKIGQRKEEEPRKW